MKKNKTFLEAIDEFNNACRKLMDEFIKEKNTIGVFVAGYYFGIFVAMLVYEFGVGT